MINRRGIGLFYILQISNVNVSRLAYSVRGTSLKSLALQGVCLFTQGCFSWSLLQLTHRSPMDLPMALLTC